MSNKRKGLDRFESVIEKLQRDLDLSNATLSGATIKGHKREVIALTNASTTVRELLASESGAIVTLNPSTGTATTITARMPTASTSSGVWYEIAIIADGGHASADVILDANTNGGANFVGILTQGGAANHGDASQTVREIGHGTITWDCNVGSADTSTFGNTYLKVVCDGTRWIILEGRGTGVSGVVNPVLTN
tara:strand:- start:80 stop:658 length:579 start_codon:yes stop_codon:yes gene_type:complete